MNTTLRSLLSAFFGVGLSIATIALAIVHDIAASSTLIAFSLLTVYGLIEMAILSYGRMPSVRLAAAPLALFEPGWENERVIEMAPGATRRGDVRSMRRPACCADDQPLAA